MICGDGKVQHQEAEKLVDILRVEIATINQDFDFTETIFKIFERDHTSKNDAYSWGIHAIKLGSHKLTPELVEEFLRIIKTVVLAFPPPTDSELNLFEKFENDLMALLPDDRK